MWTAWCWGVLSWGYLLASRLCCLCDSATAGEFLVFLRRQVSAHYMREVCRRVDFGGQLSCCLALVCMAWCCRFRLGGVFSRRYSSVVATLLLPVNFWRRLCVARVVGRISGYIAVALTLPSPLIWTQPCDLQSRETSLDTKTKLGVDMYFICPVIKWWNGAMVKWWNGIMVK